MSVGIEISRRLAAINSASSVARKVLVMTVMVWLQQYLVRHLSLEEYALFPVLMAFLLFFPLATNIFTAGLRRYITDAYAKGDEETVSEIVSTMTPILAAVAGVLLAAGLTCAYHIDSLLEIAPGLEGDARFMFTLLIVGAAFRVPVMASNGVRFATPRNDDLAGIADMCRDRRRRLRLFRAGLV